MCLDPHLVHLEDYPIHTVTGLVKQWLRELPDPLMTFTHYNDFLHAVGEEDIPHQGAVFYNRQSVLVFSFQCFLMSADRTVHDVRCMTCQVKNLYNQLQLSLFKVHITQRISVHVTNQ